MPNITIINPEDPKPLTFAPCDFFRTLEGAVYQIIDVSKVFTAQDGVYVPSFTIINPTTGIVESHIVESSPNEAVKRFVALNTEKVTKLTAEEIVLFNTNEVLTRTEIVGE